MSSKNNTEVILGGKVFTLSGYESEEYLQKVAAYINNKLAEFNKDESYRRQSAEVRANLTIGDSVANRFLTIFRTFQEEANRQIGRAHV